MCLDTDGNFSRTQPKYFERITPDGMKPSLIYADGGSPIAVLRDGNLYYVSNDETMKPGGTQVTRQSPNGELSLFPPDGRQTTAKLGITGLAPGPDGSLPGPRDPSTRLVAAVLHIIRAMICPSRSNA